MACEGALLVVDATQGVEAQTLANTYIAMENNLEIIPVINKIDMHSAEPDRVIREVEEVVGIDCSNAVLASAKAGIGIEEILSNIVEFIPPPQEKATESLRALIFDSAYDAYRGVRLAGPGQPASHDVACLYAAALARCFGLWLSGVHAALFSLVAFFSVLCCTCSVLTSLVPSSRAIFCVVFCACFYAGYCVFPCHGRSHQEGQQGALHGYGPRL